MTSIECPICGQRITAEDRRGLEEDLRDHLSTAHAMETSGGSGKVAQPMTAAPEGSPPVRRIEPGSVVEVRGGRFHQAELRREEQAWAPEKGSDVPPRPHGVGDWVKKSLGTDQQVNEQDEWARGYGYPAMIERAEDRQASERALAGEEVNEAGRPSVGSPLFRWQEVSCPWCGETVTGVDEEDLSANLQQHMGEVHHIAPRKEMVSRPR